MTTHSVKFHLRIFFYYLVFFPALSYGFFSSVVAFYSWVLFGAWAMRERRTRAGSDFSPGTLILKVRRSSNNMIDHKSIQMVQQL